LYSIFLETPRKCPWARDGYAKILAKTVVFSGLLKWLRLAKSRSRAPLACETLTTGASLPFFRLLALGELLSQAK
jgi:hypothetical protein